MNNEKSKSSLQQHVSHKIIPYREISWVKWTKDSFVWNTRLIARSEDQGLNVSIVKAHPMLRHKSRWDVKESEHLGSRGHVSATPPELDVNKFGIYTRHSNFYRENDDELRYIYDIKKHVFLGGFWQCALRFWPLRELSETNGHFSATASASQWQPRSNSSDRWWISQWIGWKILTGNLGFYHQIWAFLQIIPSSNFGNIIIYHMSLQGMAVIKPG